MDEAGIAKQKHIGVLVGNLDAPNQTSLVDCHPLYSGSNVNSSIILHTVDDILRQLEIKRENFSLFLTDAARYMSLAGKTLTEILVGHQLYLRDLIGRNRVTVCSFTKCIASFLHYYTLKELCPSLMYVTCIAHLLHN